MWNWFWAVYYWFFPEEEPLELEMITCTKPLNKTILIKRPPDVEPLSPFPGKRNRNVGPWNAIKRRKIFLHEDYMSSVIPYKYKL